MVSEVQSSAVCYAQPPRAPQLHGGPVPQAPTHVRMVAWLQCAQTALVHLQSSEATATSQCARAAFQAFITHYSISRILVRGLGVLGTTECGGRACGSARPKPCQAQTPPRCWLTTGELCLSHREVALTSLCLQHFSSMSPSNY